MRFDEYMLHEQTKGNVSYNHDRHYLLLITADLLAILSGLFLSLANSVPLLIQQLPQILGHVEGTTGISTAVCTLLPAFALVSLQSTSLAKVMTAFGDHRTLVRFLANDTSKRNLLEFFCFFVVVRVFVCVVGRAVCRADDCRFWWCF